jgi:hypothetical protein
MRSLYSMIIKFTYTFKYSIQMWEDGNYTNSDNIQI